MEGTKTKVSEASSTFFKYPSKESLKREFLLRPLIILISLRETISSGAATTIVPFPPLQFFF